MSAVKFLNSSIHIVNLSRFRLATFLAAVRKKFPETNYALSEK